MYGRREFLRRGLGVAAAVAGADLIAACGGAPAAAPSTPLPKPETNAIRLSLGACDAPFMASESFLREEGFTDIQLIDTAGLAALTGGKADIAAMFAPQLETAVDGGKALVGIGGLHPGCAQIWAAPSVATLKDLGGRTVIVQQKTSDNLAYSFLAIAVKNAGLDPASVNFTAQADADTTKSYLDGKSDAVFVATTGAVSLQSNPANKGHIVLDQAMDAPWAQQNCCMVTTTTDWLQANPVAARRALRALYRAADSLGKDRAGAAKIVTDKGLFGGAKNVAAVTAATNMVAYDWRGLDLAGGMRFYGKLLNDVALIKLRPDDIVSKSTDLRMDVALRDELKR